MHLLILLGLVVGIAIWFLTRKPPVSPTDLSELNLRNFKSAMQSHKAVADDQIVAWAMCFVADNPQLDLDRMTSFYKKTWNVKTETDIGSSTLQRVIRYGRRAVSFEPIALYKGDALPEQIIPDQPVSVPTDSIGCILVTSTDPQGGAASSLGLTQAVRSILATCPQVTSVYWDSSERLLTRNEAINELNTNILKLEWPVGVWVSSHAFEKQNGNVSGYTVGLAKMGGTEFETVDADEPPHELVARLDGVATYVVNHFGNIQNGDTIGVNEHERIRLSKAPSETIHKGWVFQLHY